MKIIVKCAWCDKLMGSKIFKDDEEMNELVTHSICSDCRIKLMHDINASLRSYQTATE